LGIKKQKKHRYKEKIQNPNSAIQNVKAPSLRYSITPFFFLSNTPLLQFLFPQLKVHDQPNTGDNHKVVVLPLVPEQLKVGCQVEPLVDREVVVELDAPRIPEVD